MTDIGKGDRVECVDASGVAAGKLVGGAVYTVSEVWPTDPALDGMTCSCCGQPAHVFIDLEGVNDWGWCISRFRPYRPGETAQRIFGHHLDIPAPKRRVNARERV